MNHGKLFGLIAHPVEHSLSPLMHNEAYKALMLPHHYQAFNVVPDQLEAAIQAMKTLEIGGLNVSIPHKERVCTYVDEVDAEAAIIGAVNTIVRTPEGRLQGFNTDGEGYVRSLLAETKVDLSKANILLLGAGGAAKAIGVYLLKMGANQLTISNRTQARAAQLQAQLQAYKRVAEVRTATLESLEENLSAYTLIIHTTPAGMWPNVEETPISLKGIRSGAIVSDIVYNPLRTAFLQEAERRGAIVHEGLGMFIYQGALAFERFTGVEAPVQVMKQTVWDHLQLGGNK